MASKSSFRQNNRTTFSPAVPPSAARISRVVADVGAPGGENKNVWTRGKAMANYPRMQRTRVILVTWLSSGFCPNWPKGWIPIIMIIIIIIYINIY